MRTDENDSHVNESPVRCTAAPDVVRNGHDL